MKIEFYEEFPNKENLAKLKLIKFPTKIFLAAKSIQEFKKYEKVAKNYKKNLEVAYWPIVKNSYWISPFSNTKDLKELFRKLESIPNSLLIDLELPLAKNWKMYFKNFFSFRKNKKIKRYFLRKNKERITTAEYLRTAYSRKAKFLGLCYDIKTDRSLMMYTSMMDKSQEIFSKKRISQIKDKQIYSISLGILATGILGNEKILPPENLEKDLKFARQQGFEKVIIFRLEGINKKYEKVLEKFI